MRGAPTLQFDGPNLSFFPSSALKASPDGTSAGSKPTLARAIQGVMTLHGLGLCSLDLRSRLSGGVSAVSNPICI